MRKYADVLRGFARARIPYLIVGAFGARGLENVARLLFQGRPLLAALLTATTAGCVTLRSTEIP